jgi:hypothetical protein
MTSRVSICLSCIVICAIAATDARAQARGGRTGGPAPVQTAAPLPSDPMTGPVVTNAPYSGDAVTTVTQILGDGTRIEQRAEAKFYRDSAGRIRREQDILGLAPLTRSTQTQTVVTIDPTPGDAFAYTLDPVARTARRVQRAAGAYFAAVGGLQNPGNQWLTARRTSTSLNTRVDELNRVRVTASIQPGVSASQTEESLGTRQMEGVKVTGRRTTSIIPVGEIGNDRAIEITDERWESPELRLLIYSRFSDPRTGVVEYKLTNVIRTEPQADLFTIPSDYTVLEPAGGRGQ